MTPASRPKRPLSAYNLFYRYKRSKILDAAPVIASSDSDTETKEQSIARIISAPVGLEEYPALDSSSKGDETVGYLRRNEIRTVLLKNLSPNEGGSRGSHRKSPHGVISFFDMNKLMCAAWQNVDELGKSVIEELAEEGKKLYLDKVKEYEAREDTDIKLAAPSSPKAKKDAKAAKTHAEDEPERPKRPLTAYNLFYRFKRSKILEAHTSGVDSKEAINDIITAAAGLEGHPSAAPFSSEQEKEIRKAEIHSRLEHNLCPKPDTSRRSHRKSQGTMPSFVDMGKLMCTSWKGLDEFGRSVFEALADEGRRIYHEKIEEFEEEKKAAKSLPKKKKSAAKKGKAKKSLKKRAAKVESANDEKSASSPRKRPKQLDVKPKLEVRASNLFLRDEAATFASSKYESPSCNNDRIQFNPFIVTPVASKTTFTSNIHDSFDMHSSPSQYSYPPPPFPAVSPTAAAATFATAPFFPDPDVPVFPDIFEAPSQQDPNPAAPTNSFVPPCPFPVVSPTAVAATFATAPFHPDPGMSVFPDTFFEDKQRDSDECSEASFDVMSLLESCSEDASALDASCEDYMRLASALD